MRWSLGHEVLGISVLDSNETMSAGTGDKSEPSKTEATSTDDGEASPMVSRYAGSGITSKWRTTVPVEMNM